MKTPLKLTSVKVLQKINIEHKPILDPEKKQVVIPHYYPDNAWN